MGTWAWSGIGVSQKFSPLPNGKDPMYNEMPGAREEWKTIGTERKGLVSLSR